VKQQQSKREKVKVELMLEGEATHMIYQMEFTTGTNDRPKQQESTTTIWQYEQVTEWEYIYIRGGGTGVGH